MWPLKQVLNSHSMQSGQMREFQRRFEVSGFPVCCLTKFLGSPVFVLPEYSTAEEWQRLWSFCFRGKTILIISYCDVHLEAAGLFTVTVVLLSHSAAPPSTVSAWPWRSHCSSHRRICPTCGRGSTRSSVSASSKSEIHKVPTEPDGRLHWLPVPAGRPRSGS